MTKKNLAELVLTKEELRQIDYALPQNFVEDCKNLLNIDPRPFYVWSYLNEPIGGYPVSLADRFLQIYGSTPQLEELIVINAEQEVDHGK